MRWFNLNFKGYVMSRKTVPVTTERLEQISSTASKVIQKTAEAVGSLKLIEKALEQHDLFFQGDEIWALRNAIRNIDSATNDAAEITDTIEQFKEI